MQSNRSVPVDTVLPHIVYDDVAAAIDWLTRVFGFSEHYRYGDPTAPEGAQMRFGNVYLMLTRARPGRETPARLGAFTQTLSLFVTNVDENYEKIRRAGAKVVEELNETFYGERQFVVEDLAGHRWLFAQHARDVSPEEWGAKLAGL